jgi:hypothetical protein
MNKRIKDLAAQAGINIDIFGFATCADGNDLNIKHFAELLIQECADVADNNYNRGFSPVGGFVKEHFR